MTQRNSLMEWLEQTRRINKSVDVICMETIDGIIEALPYVRRKTIYENKAFFDRFCAHYHKLNPIQLVRKIKKRPKCFSCSNGRDCLKAINSYVQGSITRCWHGIEMVKIQWAEVIDLLFERPELVNPALIDDYVRGRIQETCNELNKKNPLDDGMWEHFGKHWRDKDGQWREERRKRF